jgi:hypothetical protein
MAEKLRAERKHDWEKRLTEQDEEKLLEGITRYRAQNHDLILYHEGAKIDVFEPPMVISLYALTEAFQKTGDAAKVLEEWTHEEVPGAVLHHSGSYTDQNNLAQLAHELVANAQSQVPGIEHTGKDELRGVVDFGVQAGGALNIVAIDLGRIAAEVKRRREEDERAAIPTIVREALRAAIGRNDSGSLWMRPPTDEERGLLRRALGS